LADPATDITSWDATELAKATRSGELSAREVVDAHYDRIERLNPELNAIVALRPRADALADADALDSSPQRGPLHGLPMAVKDLASVAGLPTRLGSLTTDDTPAAADDLLASRLRSAGVVFVGKTNTPEFGTGSHTFNEVYGVTRNPWDLSRTPGGSSGGAAAALASRMLPLADGSDLGGSLRNPAGFCNVVGFRPGIGRVPDVAELSTHLVRLGLSGPMGRTVADAALLLSVLAEPSPLDPLSIPGDPAVFAEPLPTTTDAKIGWVGDLGLFTCEPEVLQVCRAAAEAIDQVGGSMVDAEVDLSDSMTVFRVLRGLAYRRLHGLPAETKALMKDTVLENVAYGASLELDDVIRAEALRAKVHQHMAAFFENHDVMALPTAQVVPFPVEVEYPTEIDGVAMRDYLDWMTACCVITPTSCPAVSIPAGFSDAGLPVGLQLVAPVGNERKLLEVAAAIEHAAPHCRAVPEMAR
jgi:amidase